ncbi:chromosomal replication initiator protein DnaA [Streptosporangium soli]|nr:hypothetical protein [Streptosporangium sp. KLBMP 9127]
MTVTVTTTPPPEEPEPTEVTTTVTVKPSKKSTPKPSTPPPAPPTPPAPVTSQPQVPLPSQEIVVPPSTEPSATPTPEESVSLPTVAEEPTPTPPPVVETENTIDSQPVELREAAPEFNEVTISRTLGIPALVLVLLALFAVLFFEGRLRRMAHAAAVRKAGPRPPGRHRDGGDYAGYPAGPGYVAGYTQTNYPGGTAYAPIISFVPVQTYPTYPQQGYPQQYGTHQPGGDYGYPGYSTDASYAEPSPTVPDAADPPGGRQGLPPESFLEGPHDLAAFDTSGKPTEEGASSWFEPTGPAETTVSEEPEKPGPSEPGGLFVPAEGPHGPVPFEGERPSDPFVAGLPGDEGAPSEKAGEPHGSEGIGLAPPYRLDGPDVPEGPSLTLADYLPEGLEGATRPGVPAAGPDGTAVFPLPAVPEDPSEPAKPAKRGLFKRKPK